MSNPNAHNAACDIEDMAIKASAKVDHAEMYPDSSVSFQEIRLMLKAIKEEAQYIQSLTRAPKIEPVPSSEELWEQHRQEELPDEETQDA